MNFDHIGLILFAAFFAFVIVRGLLATIRHGGFKGAMFGARPVRQVCDLEIGEGKIGKMSFRVHELEGGDADQRVGLEIVGKTIMSYSMTPIALTEQEARQVVAAVNEVLEDRGSSSGAR